VREPGDEDDEACGRNTAREPVQASHGGEPGCKRADEERRHQQCSDEPRLSEDADREAVRVERLFLRTAIGDVRHGEVLGADARQRMVAKLGHSDAPQIAPARLQPGGQTALIPCERLRRRIQLLPGRPRSLADIDEDDRRHQSDQHARERERGECLRAQLLCARRELEPTVGQGEGESAHEQADRGHRHGGRGRL
jgi:hypothetical protein